MQKRIALIIEYDGTGYVGWQTQPNGPSVQQSIERALYKLTGEDIRLHASGRTDSGVHASAQVAHFDTLSRIPPDKLAYALNSLLNYDIRVRLSFEVREDFHSRFDVIKKGYRYCVLTRPHSCVFTRNTALHIHQKLDEELLIMSAKDLSGEHDFKAFMSAGTSVASTVRRIYLSRWQRSGDMLIYDIEGSGFLYNMVRIAVGAMLDIARGYIAPDSLKKALSSGLRGDLGATAPAHGLTLARVVYKDFDTNELFNPPAPSSTDPRYY